MSDTRSDVGTVAGVGGERELARDLDSVRASQRALVEWLAGMYPVDPTTSTRLVGWTVGQVLTHLARHADRHRALLGGTEAVDTAATAATDAGELDRGARRSWDELVDDVATTCAALEAGWGGDVEWTPRRRLLPLQRQREVEVHRVDLGLGYEFTDMPGDYVRRDLRVAQMAWQARLPMGFTGLPADVLRLPPSARLAWLLDRGPADTSHPDVGCGV